MKKNKFVSLLLAMVMAASLAVPAFAETHSTAVTYTGTGVESYTVTVPATLAPGESGDVSVSDTWASNRKLTVTVPNSVTLTNSINPKDTKTLNIDFNSIGKAGDNCLEILTEGTIQVENISNALFGTWTGTITNRFSVKTKSTSSGKFEVLFSYERKYKMAKNMFTKEREV